MEKFLARKIGTFLGGDSKMLVLQTSDFEKSIPKVDVGEFDIMILPLFLKESENNSVVDFIKDVKNTNCKIIYV